MTTAQQKAFCVTEFVKTESVSRVQKSFRQKYGIRPPNRWSILQWFRTFSEEVRFCKSRSSAHTSVFEDNVRRVNNFTIFFFL